MSRVPAALPLAICLAVSLCGIIVIPIDERRIAYATEGGSNACVAPDEEDSEAESLQTSLLQLNQDSLKKTVGKPLADQGPLVGTKENSAEAIVAKKASDQEVALEAKTNSDEVSIHNNGGVPMLAEIKAGTDKSWRERCARLEKAESKEATSRQMEVLDKINKDLLKGAEQRDEDFKAARKVLPHEVDGRKRNILTVELADKAPYRLQFLSMMYPSWQALHQNENITIPGSQRKVSMDIVVFAEAGSSQYVPRGCRQYSAGEKPDAFPTCWLVVLDSKYGPAGFHGYNFQTDYAYLADDRFASLAKEYDFVMRTDSDSILSPGGLKFVPKENEFIVGADFMGTSVTAMILKAIQDNNPTLDPAKNWTHPDGPAYISPMDEGGGKWVSLGVVGLTNRDVCCRLGQDDKVCTDLDDSTCSVTTDDVLDLYHQDAVYVPGKSAGAFGAKWAHSSMDLWTRGFTQERCDEFEGFISHVKWPGTNPRNDDKLSGVCHWPHWHEEMAAVYALNLLLGTVRSGEFQVSDEKGAASGTVKLSRQLDVCISDCVVSDEVAHTSMMLGKHLIGFSYSFFDDEFVAQRKEVCTPGKDRAKFLRHILNKDTCDGKQGRVVADWAVEVLMPTFDRICAISPNGLDLNTAEAALNSVAIDHGNLSP